jgi:hypothetical protein
MATFFIAQNLIPNILTALITNESIGPEELNRTARKREDATVAMPNAASTREAGV